MDVIGFDPALPKDAAAELGINLMDLNDVWAKADFITVHTPLTPDTKDLVNEDSIAQVRLFNQFNHPHIVYIHNNCRQPA